MVCIFNKLIYTKFFTNVDMVWYNWHITKVLNGDSGRLVKTFFFFWLETLRITTFFFFLLFWDKNKLRKEEVKIEPQTWNIIKDIITNQLSLQPQFQSQLTYIKNSEKIVTILISPALFLYTLGERTSKSTNLEKFLPLATLHCSFHGRWW